MKMFSLWMLVLLTGCQTLQKPPPAEFTSDDEFRSWFAFYYRHPDPDRLPFAIKFMDQNGYLARHPDIASIFIAKVMEKNPEKITDWFSQLKNENQSTWNVLLISIWLAKTPEYKALISTHMPKADVDQQARLKGLQEKDPHNFDLRIVQIYDPRQINMLWAAYSVTGDRDYVQRIIDAVELYTADTEEIESQIGETAIMTLANNTMQYEEVRQLCQNAEERHPSPRTRLLIRAMLGAVDNIIAESQKSDSPASGHDRRDVAPAH